MIKLRSTKSHRANQVVSLAIVGIVTFDNDCECELLDANLASQLAAYLSDKELGYEVLGLTEATLPPMTPITPPIAIPGTMPSTMPTPPITPPIVNIDDSAGQEEESATVNGDSDDEIDTETLSLLNLEELRGMATQLGLPIEEWEKKNANGLRKYLVSKTQK